MTAPQRFAISLVLVLAAFPLHGQGASLVSQEFIGGQPLPEIEIFDDSGRVRSTAEWRGAPTILAPVFVRCPLACPLIAKALKRAAAEAAASPSSYRVVLFSFDPRDTPDDLRRFREQHQLPLGWTVAGARPGQARRMLDAIGYRYGEAGDSFTHPNAVIVLRPDLKTATMLPGTEYDLDAALATARGSRDWVGEYGGWMLALLLFVCLLSLIYLVTLVGTRRSNTAVVR